MHTCCNRHTYDVDVSHDGGAYDEDAGATIGYDGVYETSGRGRGRGLTGCDGAPLDLDEDKDGRSHTDADGDDRMRCDGDAVATRRNGRRA